LPRYSDELIADIFAGNDIVDYVSKYVQLKKNGRNYTGLCPFHNEKTPSFHVNSDKQLYHCFGCGTGGNLIQFVMRSENLDFTDALKLLADNAGIILPEEDNSFDDERHRKRQRIYEMNAVAARFFFDSLVNPDIGEKAQAYLSERRLSKKTVKTYGLGYAPKSYDALLNYLKERGFLEEEIIEASLAVSRDGKVYDKFRDRLMFPIIDVRGNVIGFGGRIISQDENSEYKPPKYLNSGETPAFDKGRNLFSLNLAKKTETSRLILVEGYMDVISVYQAGIPNVVATLGTALTENQAKLMCRYASEILICYDMDEAGRKAVMRAIDIFSSVGGRTKVVKLKNAKDPDEFINKNDIATFKKALDNAVPSTEFRLSVVRIEHDITQTEGKIRFLGEAAKVLSKVKDPIEVDAYINNLSEETEISKEAIYSEYRKYTNTKNNDKNTFRKRDIAGRLGDEKKRTHDSRAEIQLLNLISRDGKIYKGVKKFIGADDYSTDTLKHIARYVYDCREKGKEPFAPALMNDFTDNDEAQGIASEVFCVTEECSDKFEAAEQLVKKILHDRNKAEIDKNSDNYVRVGELLAANTEINNLKLSWD